MGHQIYFLCGNLGVASLGGERLISNVCSGYAGAQIAGTESSPGFASVWVSLNIETVQLSGIVFVPTPCSLSSKRPHLPLSPLKVAGFSRGQGHASRPGPLSLAGCELRTKQVSGRPERPLQKQWFCCRDGSPHASHPSSHRVLSLESVGRILGVHKFGVESYYLHFQCVCSIWMEATRPSCLNRSV